MTKQRVAVLGLGTMGLGMAKNLLKAGFEVSVFNRTQSKAEPLRAEGATLAATPAEAAAGAEVVISMLADDAASRAVWLGEKGALQAMEEGAVLVESSTATPAWVEALKAAAEARGCPLLDAPVTGSKPQAEAAQLSFLVGGEAAVLERVPAGLDGDGASGAPRWPRGKRRTIEADQQLPLRRAGGIAGRSAHVD